MIFKAMNPMVQSVKITWQLEWWSMIRDHQNFKKLESRALTIDSRNKQGVDLNSMVVLDIWDF